jgi:hypothetical protein
MHILYFFLEHILDTNKSHYLNMPNKNQDSKINYVLLSPLINLTLTNRPKSHANDFKHI